MISADLRADSLARVQAQIAAARPRAASRRAANQTKRARRAAGVDARHAAKLRRLADQNQENR
ncbi:hypothetical protein BBK14_08000 [Parafrankia soli]|uniref:Uncharacterized protein n=1 Tax=Parafrankia soli TaxID=2599596 RepID=A0A1S1PJG0_9ACTN|nr:hypothetical protein [Parafrankia soli]OHV21209.1 hypothetical protein BBK14_08000 [Parafrankia soli]